MYTYFPIEDASLIQSSLKQGFQGTSLAVQWLRLCTRNAGGTGLIPDWGTKILHAAWHGQEKKKKCRVFNHIPNNIRTFQQFNSIYAVIVIPSSSNTILTKHSSFGSFKQSICLVILVIYLLVHSCSLLFGTFMLPSRIIFLQPDCCPLVFLVLWVC